MTILDENGDEHEAVVGMLVQTIPGRVARIYGIYDGAAALAFLDLPIGSWDIRELRLISSEPALEEKGGVRGRREMLLANLAQARSGLDSDDWDAVDLLYRQVALPGQSSRDNYWFWSSVAESADDPRKISFATEKKYVDNDHFRRRCSVAKFLKGPARKFGLDISDEKANRIAFLVGQHFPDSNDYAFEVLYGDDAVREAYFSDASLDWGSCMHGRRYVDWYAENKESVGVLKILRGGKFVGRALLWTAMNGTTILDRIYPSDNGGHTAAAHEYARVNGWEYKTRQSMQDGCLTSGDKPHLIAMKPSSSGQYPYLDTFKYTDDNPDDGDTIHLSLLAGKFCFNDTSGDYSGRESQIVCSSCSRQVNEDCAEYYDGDPYCEDCFAENFVQLDYQLPGGSWVQGEFHRDDVTNCGSCESDRRNRDVRSVLVGSNEETWCRLCIDDNADTCECCGELCAIEHAVQVYDVIYCSRACSVAEEAPEVVVDVLPAPELEFVYPARYSYAAYCCFPSCACREIRRRRELAFPYDGAIGSWAQDEAIRHFRSCWIEAPYPNVLELEAIDRQDQADRVARETEEAYSGLAPNQWTMSAEELGLATATPEPDVAVAGLGAPLRGIMGTITGGASVPTPDRSWSELALFGLTLT